MDEMTDVAQMTEMMKANPEMYKQLIAGVGGDTEEYMKSDAFKNYVNLVSDLTPKDPNKVAIDENVAFGGDQQEENEDAPPPTASGINASFSGQMEDSDMSPGAKWRKGNGQTKLRAWLVTHDEAGVITQYLDAPSLTKLATCSKSMYDRFIYNNELWAECIERDLLTIVIKTAPNVSVPNPFFVPTELDEGTEEVKEKVTKDKEHFEDEFNRVISGQKPKSKNGNVYAFPGAELFQVDHIRDGDLYLPSDSMMVNPGEETLTWVLRFHMPTRAEIADIRDDARRAEMAKLLNRTSSAINKGARPLILRHRGEPTPNNEYHTTGYGAKSMYWLYRRTLVTLASPYTTIIRHSEVPGSFSELMWAESDSYITNFGHVLSTINFTDQGEIKNDSHVMNTPTPLESTDRQEWRSGMFGGAPTEATILRDKALLMFNVQMVLYNKQQAYMKLGLAFSVHIFTLSAKFLVEKPLLQQALPSPTSSALAALLRKIAPAVGGRMWPLHYGVLALGATYGAYRFGAKKMRGNATNASPTAQIHLFNSAVQNGGYFANALLAVPIWGLHRVVVPAKYQTVVSAVGTVASIAAASYVIFHAQNCTMAPLTEEQNKQYGASQVKMYNDAMKTEKKRNMSIATVCGVAAAFAELAGGPLGLTVVLFGLKHGQLVAAASKTPGSGLCPRGPQN